MLKCTLNDVDNKYGGHNTVSYVILVLYVHASSGSQGIESLQGGPPIVPISEVIHATVDLPVHDRKLIAVYAVHDTLLHTAILN